MRDIDQPSVSEASAASAPEREIVVRRYTKHREPLDEGFCIGNAIIAAGLLVVADISYAVMENAPAGVIDKADRFALAMMIASIGLGEICLWGVIIAEIIRSHIEPEHKDFTESVIVSVGNGNLVYRNRIASEWKYCSDKKKDETMSNTWTVLSVPADSILSVGTTPLGVIVIRFRDNHRMELGIGTNEVITYASDSNMAVQRAIKEVLWLGGYDVGEFST